MTSDCVRIFGVLFIVSRGTLKKFRTVFSKKSQKIPKNFKKTQKILENPKKSIINTKKPLIKIPHKSQKYPKSRTPSEGKRMCPFFSKYKSSPLFPQSRPGYPIIFYPLPILQSLYLEAKKSGLPGFISIFLG